MNCEKHSMSIEGEPPDLRSWAESISMSIGYWNPTATDHLEGFLWLRRGLKQIFIFLCKEYYYLFRETLSPALLTCHTTAIAWQKNDTKTCQDARDDM